LNDMLDSLLDISRIEAGGMTPNLTRFALQPLLQRLNREFMPQAHAKELRFRVFDTQAWCYSDPLLIERIIRNLLTNALHYTRRGGIVVGCRQRGKQLWLQVWDSGIGIPDEQQQSIFREFYQLANPERDRRKGLGLGLSIVQRLCALLEHPLQINSRLSKGSVFSFAMPRVAKQATPAVEVIQLPTDLPKSLAVMVLDDDPLVLDAAERFLQRLGCQPHCVATLEEALQVVLSLPKLDVLLVDYRLPNNTIGIDAAQRIHQAFGCFVPTAIITGDIAFKQLEDNPHGFPVLQKPLDGARFRALLSALSRMTTA
jgi:CheY-like chemotaxis protein